jgi:hypothetical protein
MRRGPRFLVRALPPGQNVSFYMTSLAKLTSQMMFKV